MSYNSGRIVEGDTMEIDPYTDSRTYRNKYTRGMFFLLGDSISLLLAGWLAYVTLFSFTDATRPFPIEHTLIITASVLLGLVFFKLYLVSWKYISLRELVKIIMGITVGGGLSLGVANALLYLGNYEITYTVLMMINALILIGGFRISKRVFDEVIYTSQKKDKHTIILGGENEGEQILRDILKNNHWNLTVYGIFDDRIMPGLILHGVRVLGGKKKMIEYITKYPVDLLVVAFPEMPKKELKKIIDTIKDIRPSMDIKVLPSFHSLTDDPVGLQHIRDVSIEDILGREPVSLDMESIRAIISDKVILVTGGGGSIGSELVRQCANLNPAKLIALDVDETELFYLQNEFKGAPTEITPCVASVTDEAKIDQILDHYRPDVIFHAAAYKHVPMMERFPEEAIKVNVGGTRLMSTLACKYGVDKFVLISTDKAVNPTNVMGTTKRIAEQICMAQNGTCCTKFISVRFGNVLGSRGSVIPIFIEQIKKGGPVTVTDPEMRRYFMTIPEAVLLVMQAGTIGNGGEVFVLDMGEPVNIMEMAKDLIRLHNLEPDIDIPIQITGLRPGEKLFEELLNAEEGVIKTKHDEIFKAVCSNTSTIEELDLKIDHLFEKLEYRDFDYVRDMLKAIVPTYHYNNRLEKVAGNGKAQSEKIADIAIN